MTKLAQLNCETTTFWTSSRNAGWKFGVLNEILDVKQVALEIAKFVFWSVLYSEATATDCSCEYDADTLAVIPSKPPPILPLKDNALYKIYQFF